MWKISKEFDFCYGHRVWNQNLNVDYSLDSCLQCRHLHGHQAKVIVHLESDTLSNDMVTDFKHLNWLREFIDTYLDHKFIIDMHDPLFDVLIPQCPVEKRIQYENWLQIPDINALEITKKEIIELYESFVIVDFVPTSENLSKWILEIVQTKMNGLGVFVSCVDFFETLKSKSSFYA